MIGLGMSQLRWGVKRFVLVYLDGEGPIDHEYIRISGKQRTTLILIPPAIDARLWSGKVVLEAKIYKPDGTKT
jgi:hypothetical protein